MSKSVKLMASAATTGTAKKAAIASTAGATNSQPASAVRFMDSRSSSRRPGEHPAALLEHPVHAAVELGGRIAGAEVAAHHALGHEPHLLGDALPLGHLRRGLHAVELVAEGARMHVALQGPRPARAPRRQVARDLVEAPLRLRLRQVLDHAPRR